MILVAFHFRFHQDTRKMKQNIVILVVALCAVSTVQYVAAGRYVSNPKYNV